MELTKVVFCLRQMVIDTSFWGEVAWFQSYSQNLVYPSKLYMEKLP